MKGGRRGPNHADLKNKSRLKGRGQALEHVNREKPVRRSVKKDRSQDRKNRRKKSGNKGSINPRNNRDSRKNDSKMKFSNVHQSRGR